MHSLTTRAQADAYRRQQMLAAPQPPPRFVPAEERATYRLATGLLRLVLTLLFLLILGAALYPGGEPSRPMRVAEESPRTPSTWYSSDYSH